MMTSRELWGDLVSAGSHEARLVVRTAGGDEVGVKSVTRYAQLYVIQTDDPLHTYDETLIVAPDDEVITPEQISELLDAHDGDFDECVLMLRELQDRGIESVEQLITILGGG